MEELKKRIREYKPDISLTSVNSYANCLKQLYYKEHPAKDAFNIDWFKEENVDNMIKALHETNINTRKTILAAVLTLFKDNENVKKLMQEDWKKVNESIATHKKSETQEENWLEYDKIKKMVDNQIKLTKALFTSKETLTQEQYKSILMTLILLLTTGYYDGLPPRRNMDWNELMFKDYTDTDNYITKTHFVFNKYKTSKFHGKEEIPIPKELKPFLNNFLRHRKAFDGCYLLCPPKYRDGKFKSNDMGQWLNKFFGRKIGTSMLRHIYISHYVNVKQIMQNAKEMGHTFNQALDYAKM